MAMTVKRLRDILNKIPEERPKETTLLGLHTWIVITKAGEDEDEEELDIDAIVYNLETHNVEIRAED